MDSNSLLNAAQQAARIPSDYALAQRLGITRSAISSYRHGRSSPDDATAEKLAHLAGLDPDAVVLAMHAERARDEGERQRWERIARRLQVAALGLLAVIVTVWTSSTGEPGAAYALALLPLVDSGFTPLYIVACAFGITLLTPGPFSRSYSSSSSRR